MEEETKTNKFVISDFWKRVFIDVLLLGLIMVGGQKYFENSLARKTALEVLNAQNKLNGKKDTYIEAIQLMNRVLANTNLYNKGHEKDTLLFRNRGSKYPNEIEVNTCFTKLCIYSDNSQIPLLFLKMFNPTGKEINPILEMVTFTNLIREDLSKDVPVIDTVGDRYKYIEIHKK